MQTICVFGNGLIGSAVCEALSENFHIVNIDPQNDNYSRGSVTYFAGSCSQDDIEKIEVDPDQVIGAINCSYPFHNDRNSSSQIDIMSDSVRVNLENAFSFFHFFDFVGSYNIKSPRFLVQFSSIYGHQLPRWEIYQNSDRTTPPDYVASKAAINQLVRLYAEMYKKRNIYVNGIAPGGIYNNHDRLFSEAYGSHSISKRMMNTSNLIGLIRLLVNPIDNPFSGQILTIDDGFGL